MSGYEYEEEEVSDEVFEARCDAADRYAKPRRFLLKLLIFAMLVLGLSGDLVDSDVFLGTIFLWLFGIWG